MVSVGLGVPNHDTLPGVSAADHHTATVAGDLNLADMAARAHGDLSDAPANAHHAQIHIIPTHGDTSATGAELNALTDGSAIALHVHTNNARIVTGTYTGDGEISQGITGVGFAPKAVWTQARVVVETGVADRDLVQTTDVIVDDNAAGIAMGGTAYDSRQTDAIISLDADGFTVDDNGADNDPNKDSQVYNFLVIG